MGKGKAGFSDNCLMLSVVAINLICGILGALIFSLAVWMRVEPDVRDWVRELGLFQYWNGLYILMVAGIIIMLVAFAGCCGALQPNVCLLTTNLTLQIVSFVMLMFGATILLATSIRPSFDYKYLLEQYNLILSGDNHRKDMFIIWLSYESAAIVCVAIILEFAGGILILVNGTNNSKVEPFLKNTFDRLIIDSNYNPRANRYLQFVQEKVGCCGSINYQDYDRNNLPISDYCRDAVSGNVYQDGCVDKFTHFIEKRAGWIAGISLFVAFLQILLVTFTCCFLRNVRQSEDPQGFPRKPYSEVPQHMR